MPSDGRKSIAIPEPTYERFLKCHQQNRPNERTPYWHTLNMLLEEQDEGETRRESI